MTLKAVRKEARYRKASSLQVGIENHLILICSCKFVCDFGRHRLRASRVNQCAQRASYSSDVCWRNKVTRGLSMNIHCETWGIIVIQKYIKSFMVVSWARPVFVNCFLYDSLFCLFICWMKTESMFIIITILQTSPVQKTVNGIEFNTKLLVMGFNLLRLVMPTWSRISYVVSSFHL